MSEIMTVCFQDICEITSSKRIFYEEYVNDGIPFYRSKEVIELANNKQASTELFISEKRFNEIAEKFGYPQANDILLTSVGTLGQVYLVEGTHKFYFKDGNLTWFRKWKENVHPIYICHWLKSKIGQQSLLDISIGSTQQALTIAGLKSIEVPLPTLPEQEAIAEVLSSLDDKIDLLHRNNKTLEEMAETLFRQWFVEGAKEDWEVGSVNTLANIRSGYAFKSTSFSAHGSFRLITIKNVQDGYLDLSRADFINDVPMKTPDYCLLERGDILLSLTGNVGRCCLVTTDNLLLNQRVAKLEPKNHRDWAFVYFYFRLSSTRRNLEEISKGTAQSNLSPIETGKIELSIPPDFLLSEYSKNAGPILKKILANKTQIEELSQMRDTLLPKLMSGQVRVNI